MPVRSGMLGAVGKQWIVDVHSHVVPTGDDGARTIEEGLKLCWDAAKHGTRVLYATPHVACEVGSLSADGGAARGATTRRFR